MEQTFSFKDSPTSDTILKVLDNLISMMLEPLVMYTDYGYELASSVLCLLQDNRRVITSLPRDQISSVLFAAFCNRDKTALYNSLVACELERGLIVEYVREFMVNEDVPDLKVEYGPLRRHLELLLDMYNRFSLAVVERYKKVILYQAGLVVARKQNAGVVISLDDAIQNAQAVALKALGRFRIGNGPVTTYLIKWVKYSEGSKFLVGVGESYTITRNVRTKIAKGKSTLNNLSVGVEHSYNVMHDAPTQEESLVQEESYHKLVNWISRSTLASKNRWGMLAAHLPYRLTDEEKQQLRDTHDNSSATEHSGPIPR